MKSFIALVIFVTLMGLAGTVESEATTRTERDLASEVASQDWDRMPNRDKRHACDLRGPDGGSPQGFRQAIRFVVREANGPGRQHNRPYRHAVRTILENC